MTDCLMFHVEKKKKMVKTLPTDSLSVCTTEAERGLPHFSQKSSTAGEVLLKNLSLKKRSLQPLSSKTNKLIVVFPKKILCKFVIIVFSKLQSVFYLIV